MEHSAVKILYDESKHFVFHSGLTPKVTKEEKRKKELEERKRKEKLLRKKASLSVSSREPVQTWFLLPCFPEYHFMVDILPGQTFLQKIKSLETFGAFRCATKPKSELFPDYKPDPNFVKQLKERKKQCRVYMKENQRLRWIFKRFVTRWRIQRFRCINDSDFITLAPIENPIHVFIFRSQCQYIFNAHSLLQHLHKRLLQNDGQIPTPLVPLNPYTNEAFSLAQLLGIQAALKKQGKSSWAFEGFARSQFQIERFLNLYRKPLRLHALKTILYDYSDWEGRAVVLNFMETHHEEHAAAFQKNLYAFFLREMPEDVKIQHWRSLCREYYEQEILAEDEDERIRAFYRIKEKTEHLCGPPHDLVVKRSFFLNSKKDGSQSGGTVSYE